MRVLISEHFCSGGLAGHPLDSGLLTEGGAMLRALVEDVHAAGQDVVVLLDERVPFDLPGRIVRVDGRSPEAAQAVFDRVLSSVDAALVIAPEYDGLLPAALERVERSGVTNLGSSSVAVRDCSDKHALGQRLLSIGLPVPFGVMGLHHVPSMLDRWGEVVIKPNRGAGCIDTFVCRSATAMEALPQRSDWLIQQRVPGLAASVAFIVPRHGTPIPLRAGIQAIGAMSAAGAGGTGRLAYSGGSLPLAPDLEQRAIRLGLTALPHLPGLHGYVGIDLIVGETAEADTLIEVNARPTVAYAGLRRLARFNIADIILGTSTRIGWHAGAVRYQADGTCDLLR
jgi:predicted ATP-grasp superfamily ATP-dependent carboligase